VKAPCMEQADPTRRACLLWILGSTALAGCATPSPPLQAAHSGRWTGRLALRIDSDPVEQFSAGFELQGDADKGQLSLYSPLGQVLAIANWGPQWVTLQQGRQHHVYPDTDSLTTALTGAALPLSHLFDWIQGQPSPLPGWQIDLSQQTQGRLTARRVTPEPRLELRLLLEE